MAPGKAGAVLTLERWADLRQEGWYSGDAAAYALTPHGALLEGAAEDLAVVNLLAGEVFLFGFDRRTRAGVWQEAIPNILAFSGRRPVMDQPRLHGRRQHVESRCALGQLALLNSHRPVFPRASDMSWDGNMAAGP